MLSARAGSKRRNMASASLDVRCQRCPADLTRAGFEPRRPLSHGLSLRALLEDRPFQGVVLGGPTVA